MNSILILLKNCRFFIIRLYKIIFLSKTMLFLLFLVRKQRCCGGYAIDLFRSKRKQQSAADIKGSTRRYYVINQQYSAANGSILCRAVAFLGVLAALTAL